MHYFTSIHRYTYKHAFEILTYMYHVFYAYGYEHFTSLVIKYYCFSKNIPSFYICLSGDGFSLVFP